MAAVKSLFRKVVKPVLFKLLGERQYLWFQYLAKVKDIEKKLVEEDDMNLLPLIVNKESVCFDIGANYAYYTVRLAKLCSEGKVYAFEPIPPTFKVLNKIVRRYRLDNVVALEKGVGEIDSTVRFEVPLQDSGFISGGQAHFSGRHSELSDRKIYYPWEKNRIYECRVVAIDHEFPDLRKLDFIKMDIEGAELYAIKGMANTLKKLRPVILIEICKFWLSGFNITAKELQDLINSLGYMVYRYSKKTRAVLKVESLEKDEMYNYIDTINLTPFAPNYFLIPQEKEVLVSEIKTRLKE